MSELQQSEQRRLHRHDINGMIDVIDQTTNTNLGKLANVHSEGILLLCSEPVEMGQQLNLQLTTQGAVELPCMEVKVEVRWLGETNDDGDTPVGCQILEVEDEALAVLQQLDL